MGVCVRVCVYVCWNNSHKDLRTCLIMLHTYVRTYMHTCASVSGRNITCESALSGYASMDALYVLLVAQQAPGMRVLACITYACLYVGILDLIALETKCVPSQMTMHDSNACICVLCNHACVYFAITHECIMRSCMYVFCNHACMYFAIMHVCILQSCKHASCKHVCSYDVNHHACMHDVCILVCILQSCMYVYQTPT
jgi:hypothetical protein